MISAEPQVKSFVRQHGLSEDFSEKLTSHLWEKYPELEKKFGSSGWQKCYEDVNYILAFLQVAREQSSPTMFFRFNENPNIIRPSSILSWKIAFRSPFPSG
ncbi:MAG: hypothetical protein ACPLRX_02495 [Candidatus Saccharicenans sp.]